MNTCHIPQSLPDYISGRLVRMQDKNLICNQANHADVTQPPAPDEKGRASVNGRVDLGCVAVLQLQDLLGLLAIGGSVTRGKANDLAEYFARHTLSQGRAIAGFGLIRKTDVRIRPMTHFERP